MVNLSAMAGLMNILFILFLFALIFGVFWMWKYFCDSINKKK